MRLLCTFVEHRPEMWDEYTVEYPGGSSWVVSLPCSTNPAHFKRVMEANLSEGGLITDRRRHIECARCGLPMGEVQ